MASSYSNLKFELIVTGEKTGTWGNVANDNLSIVVEEALANTASVSFASAEFTLTLTNTNATQVARHMRLNLGGTSGGAQNLVVPTIEKVYIIDNNTADIITVKTSAGSGIAVPAGKTMWVYVDGTNVIDVITRLTTLDVGAVTAGAITATSLTLTTDLAVAQGGTGASTLTDGGILLGSGTGAITATAVLADGEMVVGDGTTDPVLESGATLRASIGVTILDEDNMASDSATDVASQQSVKAYADGLVLSQATQSAIEAETNQNTYIPPDLIKHNPGVCKVWCKANTSGSTNATYNMTSVTDSGTGTISFVIDTNFSGTAWAAFLTVRGTGGSPALHPFFSASQNVGSHAAVCVDKDGVATDPNKWYFAGFGDQ